MVAGKGIVHSERERPEVTAQPHTLHGLQLWLALPEAVEEMAPAFMHYPSASMPSTQIKGVPVRVIMGSAYGLTSPVELFSDTLYIEAHLQKGQTLTLPPAQERALYVAQGSLKAKDSDIPEFSMAVLGPDHDIEVVAEAETRLAVW